MTSDQRAEVLGAVANGRMFAPEYRRLMRSMIAESTDVPPEVRGWGRLYLAALLREEQDAQGVSGYKYQNYRRWGRRGADRNESDKIARTKSKKEKLGEVRAITEAVVSERKPTHGQQIRIHRTIGQDERNIWEIDEGMSG